MKRHVYSMLVLIGLGAILVAFQIQEEQKFYFAFDEKIPLAKVDHKFTV